MSPERPEMKQMAISPEALALLGDGEIAYVKTIRSEDVRTLFPPLGRTPLWMPSLPQPTCGPITSTGRRKPAWASIGWRCGRSWSSGPMSLS